MAELTKKQSGPGIGSLTGAPVLLKQGFMQQKRLMGFKKRYFRLLQDSLFSFAAADTKTPLDEIALDDGSVEDVSWETKTGNALRITTSDGKRHLFICTNAAEHRQWFDALYYATTLSLLAEYCSPLSGGWLAQLEKGVFVKRWFVVKDAFLLCYDAREDMNNRRDGQMTGRRFVLPLTGAMLSYYKTSMAAYTFSIQMLQMGEVKAEFVFAAASEAVMNVWMEVLYVSMGNTLPATGNDATAAGDAAALLLEANLGDLEATETPKPSKAHNQYTKGNGVLPGKTASKTVKKKAAGATAGKPAQQGLESELVGRHVTEGDGGVQDCSSRTEGGAQPASPVMSAQGHAQHAWQAPAADTSSSHGANPKPPSPPPADDGGWGLGVSGLGSVFNWGDSTDKKESHSDGDSAPFGFASWF